MKALRAAATMGRMAKKNLKKSARKAGLKASAAFTKKSAKAKAAAKAGMIKANEYGRKFNDYKNQTVAKASKAYKSFDAKKAAKSGMMKANEYGRKINSLKDSAVAKAAKSYSSAKAGYKKSSTSKYSGGNPKKNRLEMPMNQGSFFGDVRTTRSNPQMKKSDMKKAGYDTLAKGGKRKRGKKVAPYTEVKTGNLIDF